MRHCLHCVAHLRDTDHLLEALSSSVVGLRGGDSVIRINFTLNFTMIQRSPSIRTRLE